MTQTNHTTQHESPEMTAHRLTAETRRRRARRRFSIIFAILTGLIIWLAGSYLTPEIGGASLSAKPAPSAPYRGADWQQLPPMQRSTQADELRRGDTLAELLARNKVDGVEADAALDVLREVFDSRKLKPGQKIRLYREWPAGHDTNTHPGRFAGFDFIPQARQKIIVRRVGYLNFQAMQQDRPLTDRYFLADTLITSSVYAAARGSGVAPNLVANLIRLFSFSIDFQRDIHEGDQLEVLYTRRFDEANQLAEEGEIIFAALTNRGKRYAYWLMRHDDKDASYYDETGRSVQRLLMKTPVDGARLSSRFGMRRHPILGYTRLHRGLDFAAPTGTPIFAAGDGSVRKIGRFGSSGLYILLKHRNGYATAYAHMSKFAKGLRKGRRVRQGQIIGYVGRTGLATGPHLHYEVLHYNKPVNPRALDLPLERKLNANALTRFASIREQAAKRIGSLAASQNVLSSLPRAPALRP